MKKILITITVLAALIYEFPLLLRQYSRWMHEELHFPTTNLPLDQTVSIYVNDFQVPYIHATTDHDLAFTLGLLHTHYRLPQMELMRLISQGRLSTVFGPVANDADYTLRILQFGKASDDIIRMFPKETIRWLEAYVDGINYYIGHMSKTPWDLKVLQIHPTRWTLKDVVTASRMASADVNWMYFAKFLKVLDNPEWTAIWNLNMSYSNGSVTSDVNHLPSIETLISGFTDSGSNSLVISKSRTKTNAGMIASDPHISVFLPSLWFLCGFDSPSYHVVGMTIPGLPLMFMGRNESIAWGATNMYSVSSHLFELGKNEPIDSFDEMIETRYGVDRKVQIRNSKYGPIISDSPFFKVDRTLALNWMGHRPSDEFTTFLKVQRAKNWNDFQSAFHGYAVLGLNYVYTDRAGNIGYVPAYSQPLTKTAEKKLWYSSNEFSSDVVPESNLVRIYNPEHGFIATSNNRPTPVSRDWGWFYAPSDRVVRQSEIISNLGNVTIDDLKKMQTDVQSPSALQWIRWMTYNINESVKKNSLFQTLSGWNGNYDVDKKEPLIFEFFMNALSEKLLKEKFTNHETIEKLKHEPLMKPWTQIMLMQKTIEERSEILLKVFKEIKPRLAFYDRWGQFHKMKLQYVFGYLPWIGRAFQEDTYPVAGGSDTIYKRAFVMTGHPTLVTYGSNARHISDLSDPDANYFVLFGSQNGYPFSADNANQVGMWEKGEYMQMPLRLVTVEKNFSHLMILKPAN